MDTRAIAKAISAPPIISDNKIYAYMLNPVKQHNRDFVQAGYLSVADGERLRADILAGCATADLENVRYNAEYNQVRYTQHITLGSGHRFRVAWMIPEGGSNPQLITCYWKEGKK